MTNIEVDGKIYFVGGHNGSDQKGIYEYNPQSDEFQLVSNTNYARNNSSLVYGSDGWIYIIGDDNQTVNIERFSPITDTVEDLGIPGPVNKPYFYWHIANEKLIYLFNSYTDSAELIIFNYELNTIENTGLIISDKMANRCIMDPDDESVIYGFKYVDGGPYKLCRLTLENYTSIENRTAISKLTVFPNPTSNYVSFKNSSEYKISTVSVIDQQGRLLDKKKFSTTLNLSKYQKGVYQLIFKDKNNNYLGSKRVVKD